MIPCPFDADEPAFSLQKYAKETLTRTTRNKDKVEVQSNKQS